MRAGISFFITLVLLIAAVPVFAEDGNATTITAEPVATPISSEPSLADEIEIDLTTVTGVESDAVGSVDEAIDALVETARDEDEVASDVQGTEARIKAQIKKLKKKIIRAEKANEATEANKLKVRIRRLQQLKKQLRKEALEKFPEAQKKLRRTQHSVTHMYQIKWGHLKRRPFCNTTVSDVPSGLWKCVRDSNEYVGTLSVDRGTMKIKPLLFEKNDAIEIEEGATVQWNSKIQGHWDGIIVRYFPEEGDEVTTDAPVNIALSLGDKTIRATGPEILGTYELNDKGETVDIQSVVYSLKGVDAEKQEELVSNSERVRNNIARVRQTVNQFHLKNEHVALADDLDTVMEEIESYNFDSEGADTIGMELITLMSQLGSNVDESKFKNRIKILRDNFKQIKRKSQRDKFDAGTIPFLDTDDDRGSWYTRYVSGVKARGIISGLQDENGNDLGLFKPEDQITVAEALKIALKTAGEQQSAGNPKHSKAAKHWARGYVKRAEELDFSIFDKPIEVDLNRKATRGEVIQMVLQAIGIDPEPVASTRYSDLSRVHRHARFIEYATDLGIISGDSNADTVRPNDEISRAEVAKISDVTSEVFDIGIDDES